MNYYFTRYGLTEKEQRLERFFEILPGLTSWAVILGMGALSFVKPLVAAILIIAFDFYWVVRLFYMTLLLLLSYSRLSAKAHKNWNRRFQAIDSFLADPAGYGPALAPCPLNGFERRNLKKMLKRNVLPPRLEQIYHVVIFPVASESAEIVESGLKSLLANSFPAKKMIVAIALENAAPAPLHTTIPEVCARYQDFFYELRVIVHPSGVAGEARVKGANATHAAKQLTEYLKEQNIPFENVIVSCFDADTIVSPQYFACLTYYYMMTPDRERASFQPIPVYHNNIWDVPSFARVLETGASFFQLVEATNPEKLVTFSSHSMSYKALVEVGYWPTDMISDDSAIFWKSYIYYEGDYRVVPIYVTVSMDIANSGTWWKTAVNVYKQKRRWAWGVENFPIVMRAFLKESKIRWLDRVRLSFKMFEGHVSWATWPFLLVIIGWFPAIFAGAEFSNSVLFYSSQRITTIIFNLAWLALFTTIILSLMLLPKRKIKYSFLKKVRHAIEWLMIPIFGIFFSAIPALDAQTRLMFGKYMEFWITEKKREKNL